MANGVIAVHDDSLYYTPGTYTESDPNVFGFVSQSTREVRVTFTPRRSLALCNSVTVTDLGDAWIRTSDGSYVGGGGSKLAGYIQNSGISCGSIFISLYNENGWGLTNNKPLAGGIGSVTFTVT